MQLLYSSNSPYARKCRVLILEKGLEKRIKLVEVQPLDDPTRLHAANPLGKVPALIRESGPALFDSPIICEYIDTLNDELWAPARGERRIVVMRQQAMADGLMDLVMGRRIELNRDITLRYPYWAERWERGIDRTLDVLEAEKSQFSSSADQGALSIAVALGYLDFRYPELDWRTARPGLAAFAARWFARDSFIATAPPGP